MLMIAVCLLNTDKKASTGVQQPPDGFYYQEEVFLGRYHVSVVVALSKIFCEVFNLL